MLFPLCCSGTFSMEHPVLPSLGTNTNDLTHIYLLCKCTILTSCLNSYFCSIHEWKAIFGIRFTIGRKLNNHIEQVFSTISIHLYFALILTQLLQLEKVLALDVHRRNYPQILSHLQRYRKRENKCAGKRKCLITFALLVYTVKDSVVTTSIY